MESWEVVSNILRVGQVSSVEPERCICRVAFDDLEDGNGKKLVSYDMQILQHRTVNAQNYTIPEVGEHVLCGFLPNGIQDGFIIGSFYTESNPPPEKKTGVYHTLYDDGTIIEYDLNTHTARVFSKYYVDVECKDAKVKAEKAECEIKEVKLKSETVDIEAQTINIKADTIKITGKVEIDGDLTATGDIMADGSSDNHHSH